MNINPSVEFQDAFCALNNALEGVEGVATIFGREKSKYSIKCKEESNPEVLDKVAFTIVLDNCKNPMDAISIIFDKLCEKFEPLGEHGTEKKKKDYRQSPKGYTENDWIYRVHNYVGSKDGTYSFAKDNGYSSFHCGFRFNGTPIEIHIETEEMFMTNNFGSADHNGVYKSRPSTDNCHQEILELFETLHDNDSLLTKLINLVNNYDNNDNEFFEHLSELLNNFNININELIKRGLTDEKIFEIISATANRYLLHDYIINSNNCHETISELKKYIKKRFNNISPNEFKDFLKKSIENYCKYLDIQITGDIKTDLIQCIENTNPILYELDCKELIPTTKEKISRNIKGYNRSVIAFINNFFTSQQKK